MSKTVEFFFDVGSPAAYLAWRELPRIAQQAGAHIEWKPMLLGGVFQATSNQSPMAVPAKGSYMLDDLGRFAKRYGCSFNHNPHFPINTLTLMRGAAGMQLREPQRLQDYLEAVFPAIWVDGKNMNDPAVVASVLQAAGFEPAAFMALVSDAAVKDALKATTQDAVSRGVFGAPAFMVDGTLYWGQDRLDFVRDALAA
ncbi:MAG: 2-hydroxychromene-2-carboxylate isomerase [Comamonadaceae bacterium]|nr:MAG: 2-hydroxychromene-2-carboxylate isomerase [Comamonadaceae bacterium]